MKSSILLFGGNWSEDAGMSNNNECLIIHTERERFLRASSTASGYIPFLEAPAAPSLLGVVAVSGI